MRKSFSKFLRGNIAGLSLILSFSPLYARSYVVNNFDDVRGSPFSFKDEKGTQFKLKTPQFDQPRGRALSVQYQIVKGGWAGWGSTLNGADVQDFESLVFWALRTGGQEKFELGLKDTAGVEAKFWVDLSTGLKNEWFRVKVPLKEFKKINLASLENMSISFNDSCGRGQLFLDDIQFESADSGKEDLSRMGTLSGKAVVDGFERASPTDLYLIFAGDDSSLKLNSSRIAHDDDYSMELEYTFSTARPWGSWVSAQWQSKTVTLDWRGAQEVRLWVKGDGSGNILRFMVIDTDGEKWFYDQPEVLKSTKWEQALMPLDRFTLQQKLKEKNQRLDLDQVRAYSVMIVGSGGSNNTTGVKTSAGQVQIDQLSLTGEQINTVWTAVPGVTEASKIKLLRIGNIDFNGQLFTEFLNAPEQRSTVSHFGKLIANGKVGNYSGRIEIASQSQEFGEAARYSASESTNTGTTVVTQSPGVSLVNLQGFANNISPYLTQVIIGNQFIDYSPYTFSPVFGFKGLSAEGDLDTPGDLTPVNYHFFVLKHRYDSFTIGSRAKVFWEGVRMTGITVYYRETAKVANPATIVNGTIKSSQDLELQHVQDDWVYTLDLERTFFDGKFLLGGVLGYNRYRQLASVNRASPFDPVFGHLLEPPVYSAGALARGRLGLDVFFVPGFKVNYEYRQVDTHFKPYYRQNPIIFDDLESDQRGHNVRFVETWRGLNASLEYDAIERMSDKKFFRHRMNWALGYYGFDKMDVAFNQELRRETYEFTSNRTSVSYFKNEKATISELYLRFQLTSRAVLFLRPRREDVVHPATGLTFTNQALYSKLEYFPTSNLKILGEFRTTHFGVKDNEPKGFPYDDNFVRMRIELNF